MFCQYCDVSLNGKNSSETTEMYNLCSVCFHDPDTLIYFGQDETIHLTQSSSEENQDFPLLRPRKDEELDSSDDRLPQKPR